MAKDIYLQPKALDPVLDSALVLTLVHKHGIHGEAVTFVDESGGEARTYFVDDSIVVKTQRPHRLRPRTSLEKEVLFLNQIAENADVSIPKVLGHGKEGEVDYTIMTRMPGVAMLNTNLEGEIRREALFNLGRTLHQIHRMPQDAFLNSGLFPTKASFEEVRADFAETFDELIEHIREKSVPWNLPFSPTHLKKSGMASLPRTELRVGLHSNPGPTHTFVDAVSGVFSGLIDFGDAYINHPAWDLWRWHLPADRQAVLDGYTSEHFVDDGFLGTWKVVMVISNLVTIAYQRKDKEAAEADLLELIKDF